MLLKTGRENNHSHVAFIREDGTGYTSVDSGHWHDIIKTAEFENFKIDRTKAQKDFYNTDPSEYDDTRDIAEKNDNSKYLLAKVVTTNNHTHELHGFKLQKKQTDDDLSDEDKVKRVYDFLRESMECEKESKQTGVSACSFARGLQWDPLVSSANDSKGRASHTLNYTKRILTYLSGLFRQNKTDIQVLPEEESDAVTTDILNSVLRRIQNQSRMGRNETQAFDDMTKTGRGALLVDIDTSWNPLGDISIKYYPWKDFSVSPHIMNDGSDAEYVVLHPMVSLNELKAKYPEKIEQMESDWTAIENIHYMKSRSSTVEYQQFPYKKAANDPGSNVKNFSVFDRTFVDVTKKKIMFIHMMERKYDNRKVAVNPIENEYADVTRLASSDLAKLKGLEGFTLVNDCKRKVVLTTIAGNTLLEERDSIFDDFNLVWCYANKSEDFFWGIVEDIRDTQLEINKWSSKFSDILNKADAWKLGVSREAFGTESDWQDYLQNASTPGYVPKFAPGFQNHIKEYSNSNSSLLGDLVPAIQQAINQMSQITNIYESAMGHTSSAESGVALAQKTRASLTGNEYLFDNFSMMKERVGQLMIQGIQKTWSPERILRLVESQTTREDIQIGGEALYPELGPEELIQFGLNTGNLDQQTAQAIMQIMNPQQAQPQQGQQPQPPQQPSPEQIQQVQQILEQLQAAYRDFRREKLLLIIENRDLARLDVTVVENTHSPTTMMSNFMVLAELAKTRPDIPVDALLDTWPFLGTELKNRMIRSIEASRQAQQREQEMKSQTELQKTLISAQAKAKPAPEQTV
jgi:hypothetical protein